MKGVSVAWTDDDELVGDELDGEGETDDEAEDSGELAPEVQALIAKAVQEREGAFAVSLRERGLDLAQDGSLVVRDPGTVATYFGPVLSQRETQREHLPPVPAATDDDEMPDPYTEQQAFAGWLEQRVQKSVQGYAERAKFTEDRLAQREAIHAAAAVRQILPQYPMLAAAADHPEFERKFAEALAGQPMEQWDNPEFLVRVAGWVLPDLSPIQQPPAQPERTRDTQGRFKQSDLPALRAEAARGSLDQSRPATGQSAAMARQADMTELELHFARQLGVSPAEYQALGKGGSGEGYYAARSKREARERQKAGTTR